MLKFDILHVLSRASALVTGPLFLANVGAITIPGKKLVWIHEIDRDFRFIRILVMIEVQGFET